MRPLLLAACLAVPALAAAQAQQVEVTPPSQSAEHDAVSAGTAPSTAGANATIAGDVNARAAAVDAANLDTDARYTADMAAWRAARRIADADGRRYLRQQRAYADAMHAWRIQVHACNHGSTAACNAPSPDPAAFY